MKFIIFICISFLTLSANSCDNELFTFDVNDKNSGVEIIDIVENKGLVQISDPKVILPIIDKVIENNPDNVQKYKNGNTKLLGFFVGQVLKATNNKANPKVVNELVRKQMEVS
jgi:Asp-tRNA(Asn)/Glu-tRNA(Gln) amidotransferase B subunit